MNTTKSYKRYSRQITLDEIGLKGQQKLQNANVLIIGAGGLGCPILLYLAGAGVGHIGIIDHDLIDETNLQRQILYHISDIGKHKADIAAERLRLFNPELHIDSYAFKFTSENSATLIKQYDLIIDGSDNFPTRYLVNDTCVELNKPLIFGSILQFEGQISVFNFNGGPDYRNIYPEPPRPEDTGNCGESGVIGTLPGIIGSLMANEAIKIICGFGEILSGKLLVFNALNNEMQCFKFAGPTIKQPSKIKETDLPTNTKEISLMELQQWKSQKKEFTLIDVRETYEFEENNIGGINIPLYELNNRLDEVSLYKRIVFCCSLGKRSKIAIQLLKNKANTELYSVILK
ncbi:ThiF family adenylyltransferase [Pedobacter sp.]|uniref:ThiF family adenylyltransferase n=1 Tax=Pedobacter sp. TaxID=1411316 RepID=UPI0035665483